MLGGPEADLSESAPVDDIEVLIRRYSRHHPPHVVDEADGQQRLSSGALRFDHDGCSCYREQVLVARGRSHDDVRDPSYRDLATFIAREVRSLAVGPPGNLVRPFDVVADPWPHGRDGAPPSDVAHALITQAAVSSRADKRARTALAQIARIEP